QVRRAIMRNHTATHLLHKALQETLGTHVKQAGSLVSADRLRFDFTHFEGVSREKLLEIEKKVNAVILEALPVNTIATSYDDAVKRGAMALFGEKYGDRVRMVEVGGYSRELCGGTHLKNSAEAGFFTILSEASVAAGVRRIEAVTGEGAFQRFEAVRSELQHLGSLLETDPKNLPDKINRLQQEMDALKQEIQSMRKKELKEKLQQARTQTRTLGMLKTIILRTDGLSVDEMKEVADQLVEGQAGTVVLLAAASDKANFVLKGTKDLVEAGFHAGKLVKEIAKEAGGSGGGKPELATAGGKEPEKIDQALTVAEKLFTGWTKGTTAR
ncbi:MAG TPA: DHHA1 domain-containing protein, partial [Candidatus Ozemobacteraceae bacterium]|nr:DHHA1 domain-containing protein [Candidatus Ozemobacteraceae bacterium]